jgi:DNA-binding CsgD family transcriptional regulator
MMQDSQSPFALLTDREKDCLRLVAQGRSAKVAAAELSIAPDTVYQHCKKAMRKLGAATSAQAAAMLLDHEAGRHPQDWGPRSEPLPDVVEPSLAKRLLRRAPIPAQRQAGFGNTLTSTERVRDAVYVMLLSIFAVGVAVSGIYGLGWIVWETFGSLHR